MADKPNEKRVIVPCLTKTTPTLDLLHEKTLLWGKPKSGKSSLASQFPGAYFIATERGHDALSINGTDCGEWDDVLAILRGLADGNHPFQTIVVDTVDNMWFFCESDLRAKKQIEYEGDMEYGKGFRMIANEFRRVLTQLSNLPYGFVLISHAEEEEVGEGKGSYRRQWPTIAKKALPIVLGMVDLCVFLDETYVMDDETKRMAPGRVLRTKASRGWAAGDRTGILPETISLGTSAEQAWKAFSGAWLTGGGRIGDVGARADAPATGVAATVTQAQTETTPAPQQNATSDGRKK